MYGRTAKVGVAGRYAVAVFDHGPPVVPFAVSNPAGWWDRVAAFARRAVGGGPRNVGPCMPDDSCDGSVFEFRVRGSEGVGWNVADARPAPRLSDGREAAAGVARMSDPH